MDSKRLKRANDIVAELLTKPSEQRDHLARDLCGSDIPLLELVLKLLEESAQTNSFLDGQVHTGVTRASESVDTPGDLPPEIPDYEILEKLGEGGFGVVYRARQVRPVRREVAIKSLKMGLDTAAVLARFEAERQMLALLEHPNIAKVLDAGASLDGRPYFVMELVRGKRIDHYCDAKRVSLSERLRLFSEICFAVNHAHQKGVIHRDLKPSNLLVSETDGVAHPKVIDFGIAKAMHGELADSNVTEAGLLLGTPAYMSPEQADQGHAGLDTRSDVYTLGVVLYQLLAGQLPFDPQTLKRRGYQEMVRILKEETPPKPSDMVSTQTRRSQETATLRQLGHGQLTKMLRGELDWIVLKAIEKQADRRYGSVSDLAQDVERFLRGEPVLAGPPGATYRLRKWYQRHRSAVWVGGLLTVAAAGLATFHVSQLTVQRQLAQDAMVEAQSQTEVALAMSSFLKDLITAADPIDAKGATVTLADVVVDGAAKLGTGLKEHPAVRMEMAGVLNRTLIDLRAYDAIPPMLDATVKDLAGFSDTEISDLTFLRIESAYAVYRSGDYDKSRVRMLKILSDIEAGPEIDTLNHGLVLRRLGLLERRARNLELAEQYMGAAEVIYLQLYGSSDENLAGFLSDRALVLNDLGQYEAAIAAYERSIAAFEAALGPDSPRVAMTLHNLSDPQRRLGDLEGAIATVEKADAIFQAALGPDYGTLQADILMTKAIQANVGQNWDRAVIHHAQATEIYIRELGDKHPRVAMSLLNHAVTERTRGRCDLAIDLFLKARALHTEIFGAQSKWVERDNEGLAACSYDEN